MLVAGFPAGALAANCYLVAAGAGEECLVIDPGQDAAPGIEEVAGKYRLRPVAVLATHGHLDHIWSVAPVCGARDIPAYIHPADRALLTDPARGFGVEASRLFGGFRGVGPPGQHRGGLELTEPDDVRELADGMTLELAGVRLEVRHAPGHTPGSVTFRLCWPGADDPDPDTLFTGDLLFAGSIGRTDLPGGDYPAILDSLARVCLSLPDPTVVLPGHGPRTTIGTERAGNPFLAGQAPPAGPARGV